VGLTLITPPDGEPLTVDDVKVHLKVPFTDEDGLIAGLISAARERAEAVTGRQLKTATWQLGQDRTPCEALILPKPPLQEVEFVKYISLDNVLTVWSSANYEVDAPAGPFAGFGRLQPTPLTSWPSVYDGKFNALQVRFVAGYGDEDEDVPSAIRQAMLLMVGAWYRNREDVIVGSSVNALPLGALALLTPYKVRG
jgi:uncharacterized phiE125 gp8 family phage protein